jgi:hypothetical protein
MCFTCYYPFSNVIYALGICTTVFHFTQDAVIIFTDTVSCFSQFLHANIWGWYHNLDHGHFHILSY